MCVCVFRVCAPQILTKTAKAFKKSSKENICFHTQSRARPAFSFSVCGGRLCVLVCVHVLCIQLQARLEHCPPPPPHRGVGGPPSSNLMYLWKSAMAPRIILLWEIYKYLLRLIRNVILPKGNLNKEN